MFARKAKKTTFVLLYILLWANTVRKKKHAGFFYARTFRFPTPVQVLNGPAA